MNGFVESHARCMANLGLKSMVSLVSKRDGGRLVRLSPKILEIRPLSELN